ncbi:HPr(Ser) kinase/phosphatase [Aerococcus kribbianus]|uniref:HPr kinase/phosphorylase n=1 Tax=Aerococcus kribbianus TaxID=2999064 RepID=A0A9X3JFW9_9LACT|nr:MULTISPECIES: HPr(Ser) kinase/phosphatase [unclassified Aerococcus]MCZ0717487.1 HPr(Ser) kinase/phosphatase [Aerococcus sp. YH-aer221]MCZ0725775.1 HPr(Ser) kinase/phosphatase [Aerococcus sp. YH-aer222]
MTDVTVKQLVDNLHLRVISGEDYLNRNVATADISRPGLEITGYFNYYPSDRIQLFGRAEATYLSKMTSDERLLIMRRLAKEDTPVFVFSRDQYPEYEAIQAASENGIPILGAPTTTTRLSSSMADYLHGELAERESKHGVFVEVYGLGLLIMGASGVGKSEAALELIKNGHRLVADDRVDFYQKDERTLHGEAPAILKNLMEIRGLGIIDVMTLYGAGAVRSDQELNLIVHLKRVEKGDHFDRLGSDQEMVDILGVNIPRITVPVQMGQNISNIIEVAAMNFRARNMGFNATETFEANLSRLIDENKG